MRKSRKTEASGPESKERPGWGKGWGERQEEDKAGTFRIAVFIFRARRAGGEF